MKKLMNLFSESEDKNKLKKEIEEIKNEILETKRTISYYQNSDKGHFNKEIIGDPAELIYNLKIKLEELISKKNSLIKKL